jgi:hypothetical protein
VYAVQGVMTVSADRDPDRAAHRGPDARARRTRHPHVRRVSMRTLYLDPRIAHGLSRECRVVDAAPGEIILRAVDTAA